MMFRRVGSNYIIRLERGEELFDTVREFMRKYGMTAGFLSGIGATDDVTIGFYDFERKEYITKNFQCDLEILNLTGNATMYNSEPFLHIHATLGDSNFNVIGGHLISAKISVTAEIYLHALDTSIERKEDSLTQLKLMKL
jgi:predicted DNA-binding protein with PD1-like motif